MRNPSVDTVLGWVSGVWPVDGPHTPQRMAAAGVAVEELTRYLAYATRRPVPAPQTYELLGNLVSAVHGLNQVCRQLTDRLTGLAEDPTLRVDELGASQPPEEVAVSAAAYLDHATDLTADLADALSRAQAESSRLYHADPAGGAR